MQYHAELNELREIERLDHGKREGGAPQKLDIFYAEKSALFLCFLIFGPRSSSNLFLHYRAIRKRKTKRKKIRLFFIEMYILTTK